MGHGEGYKYAHDFEGGYVEQDYLGVDKTYYTPTDRGYEAEIGRRIEALKSSAAAEGPAEDKPPLSEAPRPATKAKTARAAKSTAKDSPENARAKNALPSE